MSLFFEKEKYKQTKVRHLLIRYYLFDFPCRKDAYERGERVICRDGILGDWRYGYVVNVAGDNYKVRFRSDAKHPTHYQWLTADRLLPQSVLGSAAGRFASTAIRFFADRFNRYNNVIKAKFKNWPSRKNRRKVRFRSGKGLKETLMLSPKSCFVRSEEELADMKRLEKSRRQDRRNARENMKKLRVGNSFFISDYTRYITEDEDDDDVPLPINISVPDDFRENDFRDDDEDDGGDAMSAMSVDPYSILFAK